MDSNGEPVNLLGHSYGAICALEAATLTPHHVDRLILYEPPINVTPPPDLVERLEAMLEAGDREGVIVTFVREIEGLEPEEVPEWQMWVPFAHTSQGVPSSRSLRRGSAVRRSWDADVVVGWR
jgi:pimeloyl-ACP methyl ester carboxylesterase